MELPTASQSFTFCAMPLCYPQAYISGSSAIRYSLFIFFSLVVTGIALSQPNQSDLLRAQAERLFEARDYPEAMQFYQRAYDAAMPGDRVRAANICVDISTVYHTKGDFVSAKNTCIKGLTLLQKTTTPDSVVYKLHASLGQMYHVMYMHDSAHYHFSESMSIYRKHPALAREIPDYVAFGLNNQALLFLLENNFHQAETLFEKAIEVLSHDPGEMALLINNYAGYLDKTGQYAKAVAHRVRAIQAVEQDHPQLPSMLLGLAWDYFSLGNIAKSRKTLIKARSLQIENPISKARLHYGLAQCALADQKYADAEQYLKEAINVLQAGNLTKGKLPAEIHLTLARIRELQNRNSEALSCIQRGLIAAHLRFKAIDPNQNPEFEGTLSEITAFQLLWEKARLLKSMSETTADVSLLKNSLASYETLIDFRNKMLVRLDRLETQTFVTENQFDLFEEALEVCYKLWQSTHNKWYQSVFFSIQENSRASALSVSLLDLRVKPTTIPDSLNDQERKLLQRIAREKSNLTNLEKNAEKLRGMEFELAQIQDIYKKAFPAYYQARYAHERISLPRLQQLLPADQTYLDYFTGENAVYAICVTRDDVQIKRINIAGTTLQNQVNALARQIYKDPGLGAYDDMGMGKQLYQTLLQPFAKLLKPRLLIARGGVLNKLPFEILQDTKGSSGYLIHHKRISYAHAATIHFNKHNESASAATWLTVAPFSKPIPGSAWPVLKSTSETALQYGGDVLRDKSAQKSRFIALSRQYGVINLATHATASDRLLDESLVTFYPEPGRSYQLHASEIMQMELPKTRLVILGACQGGSGTIYKGEGVQSLAYSFAYAGCPSVVSTIWAASDTTTAFLIEKFAQYSQKGYSLDQALFKARTDYFESELGQKYDHPFYWSNLVLWGQSTPIPVRDSGALWLLWLVPATAIAGTISWKSLRKRQLRS
ncbi:MAG: CHAT domain-containing protein [Dyadobacter fermentans]